LDVGRLATSFSLLQLPKMPEIKTFKNINFTPADVDVGKIQFKDKAREKSRKQKLSKPKKSKQKAPKEKREVTMEPEKQKQESSNKQETTEELTDDIDQLFNEERLYKKLKKRKISEEEFDAAVCELDDLNPAEKKPEISLVQGKTKKRRKKSTK